MNALDVIDTIKGSTQYSLKREVVSGILEGFGWRFLHDEPGRYDPPPPYHHGNGFLVYQTPISESTYAFYFEDDSYNGGYLDYYSLVTAKEKQVTVYEPVTKTVKTWG